MAATAEATEAMRVAEVWAQAGLVALQEEAKVEEPMAAEDMSAAMAETMVMVRVVAAMEDGMGAVEVAMTAAPLVQEAMKAMGAMEAGVTAVAKVARMAKEVEAATAVVARA